ncbi:WD-40 repeat protein, partial [Reticulomyxa filosa]
MTAHINHEQTLPQLVVVSFIPKLIVFNFLLRSFQRKTKSKLLSSIGFEYYTLDLDGLMISIVVNYVTFFYFVFHLIKKTNIFTTTFFMFDTFRSSSKLVNTFTEHTDMVYSIDYLTFGDYQFICSGTYDKTVRVWDVDDNKQIQSFNGHSDSVYCVNFHHIIIIIIVKMSLVLHHMKKQF